MEYNYICSYSRTAIGSFKGSLSKISAPLLGSAVIESVINKTSIDKQNIDEVIMGNVLSANLGQAPSRQASINAGLGNNVTCTTINKVCGSGMKAIMLADQSIHMKDSHIVIAGGMENMSKAPYYIENSKKGMIFEHDQLINSILKDGLWDPYNDFAMGNCGEILSKEKKYSKLKQDEFAIESYKRSNDAITFGKFKNEITSVKIKHKNNEEIFKIDEEPLRFNQEKLIQLQSAFKKNGTITAGNASSLSDGAAAVFVSSKDATKEFGIDPIAKIISHVSFATEPKYFTKAPVYAIKKLLKKINLTIDAIDLFEVNEAFSCVTMFAMDELKIPHEKINVNGGAVSLGHPIGASGTRIVVTLLNAMKEKNLKYGIASLCIGGGEATAILLELCN